MATMSVTGTVTMEAPFSILSDGSDLLSPLRLVHMCDLPVWMQKDVYIRHGYRRPQASFRACVKSLFYTHNETVNIWSHLFTSAFMIGLLAWTATPAWHGGYYFAEADITALQFYLVCQTLCLWFSAFYHCANCHSEGVAKRCLKLDYLGIVFSVTSTDVSMAYFSLYKDRELASAYITTILAVGAYTFWTVLDPEADGAGSAAWRAFVFALLAGLGFVPILHASLSSAHALPDGMAYYLAIEGFVYLIGASFYVTRTPERHWPEMFDIWGSSHQIFHIVINLGQILHIWGLTNALLHYHQT